MAKKKYHFNPEHLTITPVQPSLKRWISRTGLYILISLIIGSAAFFLTTGMVKTPREKNLIAQNEKLLALYSTLDNRLDEYDRNLSSIKTLDDSIYRSVVGMNPLSSSIRDAGIGGHDPGTYLKDAGYPGQVINTALRIEQLDSHLKIQENSYREVIREAYLNKRKLSHLPAIMPISNKGLRHTGSGFGIRLHPILKIQRMHEGIDFFASTGTDIFATADGIVKDVRVSTSFGKVIEIDHGYGILTLYAHLSKFNVRKGQRIERGNIIGQVGNTGLSSGQHLHYEVHLNGMEVDPVNYFFRDLSPAEYRKVVAIAQAFEMSMD